MAPPERPPAGRRDELLSRLEQLQGKGPATVSPAVPTPDELTQAAQRLTASARELEGFVERRDRRLDEAEKAVIQELSVLRQRLDGALQRVTAETRAMASERWAHDTTLLLVGWLLGLLLGAGIFYVRRNDQREDLARQTHQILTEILENQARSKPPAGKSPAPSPPAAKTR
jgi:hypothetical protein